MWSGRTFGVWHEGVRRCLALRPSQKQMPRTPRAHEASALRTRRIVLQPSQKGLPRTPRAHEASAPRALPRDTPVRFVPRGALDEKVASLASELAHTRRDQGEASPLWRVARRSCHYS